MTCAGRLQTAFERLAISPTGQLVLQRGFRECAIRVVFRSMICIEACFDHATNRSLIDPKVPDVALPMVGAHEFIHGIAWHRGSGAFRRDRHGGATLISKRAFAAEEAMCLATEYTVAEELADRGHPEHIEWLLGDKKFTGVWRAFVLARLRGDDPVDAIADYLDPPTAESLAAAARSSPPSELGLW